MIEERLESLIEMYTIEIEDDTECLKKYKDELENVLKESDCLSEVDRFSRFDDFRYMFRKR